MYFLVQTIS